MRNSIGGAKEAANNGSNRAGGGGAERLLATGTTVLDGPGRLLTTKRNSIGEQEKQSWRDQ